VPSDNRTIKFHQGGSSCLIGYVQSRFFGYARYRVWSDAGGQSPGDSVVYVGWAGSDSLRPQYAGSHLKAILDASNARDLFDKTLPQAIEKARPEEPGGRPGASDRRLDCRTDVPPSVGVLL